MPQNSTIAQMHFGVNLTEGGGLVRFKITDHGNNDILKIKFRRHNPGTKVHFSVGKSFATSRGETITDLTDKLIKVSFPNSIFLSIEHETEDWGRVNIEFWYKDHTVENEDGEQISDGYSLITEVKGKY